MDKQKVFITGGAGFLGSAIIAQLVNNYEVIAIKRVHTDLYRCEIFQDKINWIDTSDTDYKAKIISFKPDVIVHAAWSGVSSKERADWYQQIKNFELLNDILEIAKNVELKKLIVLGSQAEYGNINGQVDENYPVNANDAYSACKLASQKIIEAFCGQYGIDWYWLRVFSVFGPGEANNWLIPWIVNNQLKNVDTDLTWCEQKYDYLYIDDFAAMITNTIKSANSESGIYNVCSGESAPLKNIVTAISQNINGRGKLNFGAIPYRANQSMEICGDNSKYTAAFGINKKTDFSEAIIKTVSYYQDKFNKGLSV